MTIPIARMVATRYHADEMPLRLYYIGSVFRYAEPQAGRHREFTQVGIELIGAAGPRADAEVVALAAGVLESLGLASFRLDLGHSGFFQGLVESVTDSRLAGELKEALLAQDYVRYEAVVKESGLEHDRQRALLALPTLRGEGDVLEEARMLAEESRQALCAIDTSLRFTACQAFGLAERVGIDLGITKDLDYYSGLLIEGYTPQLGFTLGSGAGTIRWWAVLAQEFAATGFAFGVERAMLALDRQGWREPVQPAAEVFLAAADEQQTLLFELAATLRQRGVRIEVDVNGLSPEQALEYARRKAIPKVTRSSASGTADPSRGDARKWRAWHRRLGRVARSVTERVRVQGLGAGLVGVEQLFLRRRDFGT